MHALHACTRKGCLMSDCKIELLTSSCRDEKDNELGDATAPAEHRRRFVVRWGRGERRPFSLHRLYTGVGPPRRSACGLQRNRGGHELRHSCWQGRRRAVRQCRPGLVDPAPIQRNYVQQAVQYVADLVCPLPGHALCATCPAKSQHLLHPFSCTASNQGTHVT